MSIKSYFYGATCYGGYGTCYYYYGFGVGTSHFSPGLANLCTGSANGAGTFTTYGAGYGAGQVILLAV